MRIIGNLFQNNANFIPKVFGGIDTENILASGTNVIPYTATQDCWFSVETDDIDVLIDGISIMKGGIRYQNTGVLPLKKGQTLTLQGNYNSTTIRVFGIKY